MSQTINLEPINAFDHTAFVGAFASVFEHFPQAAEGALERRIGRSTQQELDEALAQIASITRARLNARLCAL
jgi:2-oxo-4-hydroxy-4-carboxy--5-ureidoimidazoline (OHCU) decarboxylase